MPKQITDAEFNAEVLQSKEPVLVDFWAPWCGPCQQLGPIIEELATENEGKPVKILKLNVDDNQDTASKYGVMSIPTMIFFKDGQPVEQMVGVQEKSVLQAKLDELS